VTEDQDDAMEGAYCTGNNDITASSTYDNPRSNYIQDLDFDLFLNPWQEG